MPSPPGSEGVQETQLEREIGLSRGHGFQDPRRNSSAVFPRSATCVGTKCPCWPDKNRDGAAALPAGPGLCGRLGAGSRSGCMGAAVRRLHQWPLVLCASLSSAPALIEGRLSSSVLLTPEAFLLPGHHGLVMTVHQPTMSLKSMGRWTLPVPPPRRTLEMMA